MAITSGFDRAHTLVPLCVTVHTAVCFDDGGITALRTEEMVLPLTNGFKAHRGLAIGAIAILSLVRLTPPAVATPNQAPQMYGETAQPNQVGKGYVVFQRQGQRVVGAFHYPQSEFSCFVGEQVNQQLEVTTLGLGSEAPMSVQVPLTQLHTIATVGQSEQHSLKVCQQEVATLELQGQPIVQSPIAR